MHHGCDNRDTLAIPLDRVKPDFPYSGLPSSAEATISYQTLTVTITDKIAHVVLNRPAEMMKVFVAKQQKTDPLFEELCPIMPPFSQ